MKWRLRDKVYSSHITVLFCEPKEAERHVRRKYGDKDTITPETCAITMRYTVSDHNEYVMWFRVVPSMSTLAHESLHLALFIMEENDIRVTAKDSEPVCYYLEFLVNSIRELFVKHVQREDRIV